MSIRPIRPTRRSATLVVAAVAGLVSLALGAHAALNLRAPTGGDTAATVATVAPAPQRLALVIGNGHYPDAAAPLDQPINDARALADTLRAQGFDVDMLEDANRRDMRGAIDRLAAKVTPESVVMLFFGGYGVQAGRDSYMIPVDAAIWTEADVRRSGIGVEATLAEFTARGAHAKLAVIDASRRNPYERRFRRYSHGLAPIGAPADSLILSSAAPGQVADDGVGLNSVLVSELIGNLAAADATAESAFDRTRLAVSRTTDGAQMPSISSSLAGDVRIKAATVPEQAAQAGS
jgi:uncharacterized caspase-like protein